MIKEVDAIVTYGWCRSSYVAIRSLARFGLRVGVADTGRVGMGQWSRHAEFVGTYSCPLTEPREFIRDICRILEETGAHFLLPGHDESEVLARFRDELPTSVTLPLADAEILELANDKSRTASLAATIGISVPQILEWKHPMDLRVSESDESGKLVVKLRRGNSAKGVFYADDLDHAASLCEKLIDEFELQPKRYPIVQRYASGDGWGVSCLYWNGKRIAHFTHKRLREKTDTGGTSTLRVAAENALLESWAFAILEELNWHGIAMVEFKYDAIAKTGWFIEINPRLWGSIHLAVTAGVDFPSLLYIAATQGAEAAAKRAGDYQRGIVARWYLGDMIIAAEHLRRLKPGRAIKALLPGDENTIDDWQADDRRAFFGQAAYYLWTFLRTGSTNPIRDGMVG
jgi:predicted ATP-grasp superfamily ATP-dependent carboligase